MLKLNFPTYKAKVKKSLQGEFSIFDPVRKKYYVLTPEEWVRQHLVNWLHSEKNISYLNMVAERQLDLNGTKKRFDLLIYKREKADLLVECKAPNVPLTMETCEQIARYNLVLKVPHLMITNGLVHFFFSFDELSGNYLSQSDYHF